MIIVTGGAGFIGSVLIWQLNNMGYDDILIVDSLKESEKWKNLVGLNYADYIEKEPFLEQLEEGYFDGLNVEAVFHLGACSSTTEKNASYLAENNYTYSKIVAKFATDQNARFIYASSAATYGNGDEGYSEVTDIQKLRPLNMYGYSKQMFDLWMLRQGLLSRSVGLKYFNVYGPNEYHKGDMKSLICKAVPQIQQTGKLQLFKSYLPEYGDGEQKRDFIYVKDAVKMTAFFLENREANGLFNIGTGSAHSWNELAEAVFEGMDLTPEIEYIEMPEHLKPKYQYFTQADILKIRSAGYNAPITPFKETVKEYVKEYLLTSRYITEVSGRHE